MKAMGTAVVLLTAAMGITPAIANDYEGIEITVNINTANAEELDKLLIGVGPDKALKIIEYRNEYGLFSSAEELAKVKGIGGATVEKNRERIKL
ncbi:ComEA family DNA-binding protein [Photobacterium makurazakiensis]|uniref:ComEA family DNA-binding protein n=1 Tax=Photobacterium makurazakiensis TaxID=2910234 RepID=UPI003D12EF68